MADDNYGGMSDRELADASVAAVAAWRQDVEDADSEVTYIDNEILFRANVPLNESELGITPRGQEMIDAWVDAHRLVKRHAACGTRTKIERGTEVCPRCLVSEPYTYPDEEATV